MERYKDCYGYIKNNKLIIGNEFIERQWDLSNPIPVSTSIFDKHNQEEWCSAYEAPMCFNLPHELKNITPQYSLSTFIVEDSTISVNHLLLKLHLQLSSWEYQLHVVVYPNAPFLRQWITIQPSLAPLSKVGNPLTNTQSNTPKLQLDDNNTLEQSQIQDYIDAFVLKDTHCSWKSIILRDITDLNNNLVSVDDGLLYQNENRWLEGNIMTLNKILTGNGLVFLKESPPRTGQLNYGKGDYRFVGQHLYMTGSGLNANDFSNGHTITTYGSMIGVFSGDDYDASALLDHYHRHRRQFIPERDSFVMSNTWGDRAKDGRISESFILSELEYAHQLGITHVQIDDGWEIGVTANSTLPGGSWADYYSSDTHFWEIHPERFPNGLGPVVEKARSLGISLGLWFSPDSSQNFSHWEDDADTLIDLYKKYDIRYFKLDGIQIREKQGEANLIRMMEKVTHESSGQVYFNLDETADVRTGYFGPTQYGGVFLENRYTDWGVYYPHYTLRNLWKLAPYFPPHRLQMEFLNVSRNEDVYKGDPLAPSKVGISYAFATVMFSNPLAWMELSGLNADDREKLASLIHEYRKFQDDILSGHILPIGQEPNGTRWTGFQSITGENKGYVLVLRELNSKNTETLKLHRLKNNVKMSCILHSENIEPHQISTNSEGYFQCQLTNPFSFALYKYQPKR